MYPSERYAHLLETRHPDVNERIKDYVDESHHQGITLKELECQTWREVINALVRYELTKTWAHRHTHLIDDYKLHLDALASPPGLERITPLQQEQSDTEE